MTNYQYADQLYEIDTNGMEDDLDDAKDTLQEAEDALAAFEEQIGDGTVYAEYSGTILSLGCSAGDTLTDEMVVATYADPDNVTMAVSVSQDDIAQISVGSAAELTLTAYGDESFSGEVSSIATSATVGSSTVNYEVTVRFTGDVDKIYADMTGEATFVEKEAQDVLCISNKAVHQDGARSWVKVLGDDGSVTETTIETGFSNGTKVEVLSGLNEGDIVLVESQVTQ
jgi:HlyD family secretion protein